MSSKASSVHRHVIAPLSYAAMLLFAASCGGDEPALSTSDYACDDIPRPENANLPLSDASDDWFQVYESAPGVYSIVEPFQIEETISHLIVGTDRALLFDTGLGLLPIKPVVERITELPVTVLNSHTHYDHVGGNWEFDSVLAVDTEYTRANMAGFANSVIGIDFVPEAFCKGVPDGVDLAAFATKPWRASALVADGDVIELGDRVITVLHVPGHTPDSLALLDADNRLLFTGDTWYDASLWLFVRETNLDEYEDSIARLVAFESNVDYLLGAHNSSRFDAGILQRVQSAIAKIRAGDVAGEKDEYGRLAFDVDGVEVLTSQPAIDGMQGDLSSGGAGLDLWPAED